MNTSIIPKNRSTFYLVEENLKDLFLKNYPNESNYLMIKPEQILSWLQSYSSKKRLVVLVSNLEIFDVKLVKNIFIRSYTSEFVFVTKSYTDSIQEGKIYQVLIQKDKHFPNGERCVIGKNGQTVTLDCFQHQQPQRYSNG